MEGRYKAPAVVKAFEILRILSSFRRPLSLTEISKELGLNKSSTLGLLRALEDVGVVKRDGKTKKYERTFKLLDYTIGLDTSHLLIEASGGILEEISKFSTETIFLGHLKGDVVTIVKVIEGKKDFVLTSSPGTKIPANVGALGKAISSFERGERSSFYIDYGGEYLPGVSAVCSPIVFRGRIYGFIWIAGYNIPKEKLEEYGKILSKYTRIIKERLEGKGA